MVVVQATFVLAVGLLAGAVLLYARIRDLIIPLMVITPVLVGFAGARVLLWSESLPLRFALEVGYRVVLLIAAIALLRARRGRWHASAWLLALCLLALHLAWAPFTEQVPAAALIAAEIALPITMLLLVLGEMRARTRRLQALQSVTDSIASAQQYGSVVQCAVEELQRSPAYAHAGSVWSKAAISSRLMRPVFRRSFCATPALPRLPTTFRNSGRSVLPRWRKRIKRH